MTLSKPVLVCASVLQMQQRLLSHWCLSSLVYTEQPAHQSDQGGICLVPERNEIKKFKNRPFRIVPVYKCQKSIYNLTYTPQLLCKKDVGKRKRFLTVWRLVHNTTTRHSDHMLSILTHNLRVYNEQNCVDKATSSQLKWFGSKFFLNSLILCWASHL